MTTPFLALPLSTSIPGESRKRRVLLIGASSQKRELRSEIMRKLGMEVDCAADIAEARCWWKADLYDLVLIDMEKGKGHRDRFCDDLRGATPSQQIAFFVGKPEYLAESPVADGESEVHQDNGHARSVALSTNVDSRSQYWGIMEASRRISAARSASNARTQAIRNLPAPPRDSEVRLSRCAITSTLDDLMRKEIQ